MENNLNDLITGNPLKHLTQFSHLLETRNEAETLTQLNSEVSNLGFSKFKFILMRGMNRSYKDAYVYSNYSPEWLSRYDRQGFWKIDPLFAHSLQRKAPLIWNADTFTTTPQQAMYEEGRQYGIHAGITLPLGTLGSNGMLTCVSDSATGRMTESVYSSNLPQLVLLRDIAFDSLSRFIEQTNSAEIPNLSLREKECLQWHALGKTSWETGNILNISEACVNYHFNNIRIKFNVSQRHQAVIKAIMWGLIPVC